MTKQLPSAAQVVVIGGGVMGCSTLYHLAKLGVRDAILLERKQLGCGTTWHSSAQVRQLRSTSNLTSLIKYSVELYSSLEAETGQATGWIQTGTLNVATSPDRMTHLKRQASLARLFGVETELLGPEEASRMWPAMRTDDIVGATFSPEDGRVNPQDLCMALVKGARAEGAQVFEETPVTGIDVEDGRVTGVWTESGHIACEAVVNCAGIWARELGKLAGVSVPLYACEHFYLLTEALEGVDPHLPTLGDPDGYLYIRDEVGGLLVGSFEPNPKPLPLDKLPKDFAFDLLNEDWDHFEPMMENALNRIPALETAPVKMLLNGPESFTPDNAFLLGEAPEVQGFYLGCGMNSMGVATAGGAGKALAEWIIAGEPPMDLWSVDPRRFPPVMSNESVLRERSPEILGLHYAIDYPGREPRTARGLRRSPLYDRLAAKGAHFTTRMAWERPGWFAIDEATANPTLKFGKPDWFEAVAQECRAARDAAVVIDQTPLGKLLVQGPDAEQALQRLCANNMAVPVGRVVYSPMLNADGGYESDVTAFRLAKDSYLLVTSAGQPVRDLHWIRSHLDDGARVSAVDVTNAYAVLCVTGPRSRTVLERVSPADFSDAGFKRFTWRNVELGSGVVMAARLSYAGELGWELYLPVETAAAIYDELMACGEAEGLRDAGSYAMTSMRIEKGYRAWGHDVTPDYTPFEAGLGFSVKLSAPTPFIGQEALSRQKKEGTPRRLVHLKLRDPSIFLQGNEPIVCDGRIVGQVTSAAYGYALGASVAMGYVERPESEVKGLIEKGAFEIEYAFERFSADASLAPFFDPDDRRPRM